MKEIKLYFEIDNSGIINQYFNFFVFIPWYYLLFILPANIRRILTECLPSVRGFFHLSVIETLSFLQNAYFHSFATFDSFLTTEVLSSFKVPLSYFLYAHENFLSLIIKIYWKQSSGTSHSSSIFLAMRNVWEVGGLKSDVNQLWLTVKHDGYWLEYWTYHTGEAFRSSLK